MAKVSLKVLLTRLTLGVLHAFVREWLPRSALRRKQIPQSSKVFNAFGHTWDHGAHVHFEGNAVDGAVCG